MGFTRPKKAIGLDIGTHSAKAVLMSRSGGRLRVEQARQVVVDRNQLNNDPIEAQAQAVREALRGMPVGQCLVVPALAGQTVVVRYPRLASTSRGRTETAMRAEAAHSIPYDLNDVFLDWSVLDEYVEEEQKQLKILLVAAKHEVIDARMQVLQAAEVQPGVLGVDSLSLADAAESCDFLRVGETVAMIDLGLTSAGVHFIKDGISNFIREVNWGAREMVQAIAKDRRCNYDEALKQMEEFRYRPEEVPYAPEAEAVGEDDVPVAEAVIPPMAMGNPSLLDPLDDEYDNLPGLAGATKTNAPSRETFAPAPASGPLRSLPEILAAPLARMASEFRRSFDFYEHQLYERAVDRIILCGGAAMFSLVRETLQYELGLDNIEIAHPDDSALLFGDWNAVSDLIAQPPQFMVAVGLAARGMADL